MKLFILPNNLQQQIAPIQLLQPSEGSEQAEGMPEPLSDVMGRIRVLLFHYQYNADERFGFTGILVELLQKMTTVDLFAVLILEGSDMTAIPEELKYHPKIRWINYPKNDCPKAWMQDYFLVLSYPQQKGVPHYIIQPGFYSYFENSDFPKTLSQALCADFNFRHKRIREIAAEDYLIFEGGNVLVGDRFILIGAKDQRMHAFFDEWLLGKGQAYNGKSIYYLGANSKTRSAQTKNDEVYCEDGVEIHIENVLYGWGEQLQPLYHLDLFISLAGRNADGSYNVVIGQPCASLPKESMSPETWEKMCLQLEAVAKSIDQVVHQLENSGENFKVTRIQMPLVWKDEKSVNEKYQIKRTWFFISYNNCLVEQTANAKKVWLPSYGNGNYTHSLQQETLSWQNNLHTTCEIANWTHLKKFDAQAIQVWQNLGFDVCMLEQEYLPAAFKNGSLRCMLKVILRDLSL